MKIAAITASALVMATFVAAETPAPTTPAPTYDEELGCWPISVEHDATYCIDGPICSGSGAEPAGWNCPVAGDVAIADCHNYLVSYTEGDSCVLPVDATCQVIKTGAWGCVISGATPSPTTTGGVTPAPTTIGGKTPSPTSNGGKTPTPTGTTKPTPPTPTPTHTPPHNDSSAGSDEGNSTNSEDITFSSVAAGATAGGVSAGAVAAIAAAAAAVCAAVGTVLYKKYHQTAAAEPTDDMVNVVTP